MSYREEIYVVAVSKFQGLRHSYLLCCLKLLQDIYIGDLMNIFHWFLAQLFKVSDLFIVL